MEMFLTRQRNGLYMLTKQKPIFAKVEGRDFEDAYFEPGEPIGIRNLCDLALMVFKLETPLKRGQTIKVLLQGFAFEKL